MDSDLMIKSVFQLCESKRENGSRQFSQNNTIARYADFVLIEKYI